MSYGASVSDAYRQSSSSSSSVKTAKALGFEVSDRLLALADEVIERCEARGRFRMKLPTEDNFSIWPPPLPRCRLRPTPIRRPRPAGRQGRSLAGTLASLSGRRAPLGKRVGAPEVSRYSRPAFCEGSYRRLTRLSIEGEALLARQRVPLAFVGQAVTNRIANAPYVLDLGLERPTALAYSNFILL